MIPGWFQVDFKMIFKWFWDVLGRFWDDPEAAGALLLGGEEGSSRASRGAGKGRVGGEAPGERGRHGRGTGKRKSGRDHFVEKWTYEKKHLPLFIFL